MNFWRDLQVLGDIQENKRSSNAHRTIDGFPGILFDTQFLQSVSPDSDNCDDRGSTGCLTLSVDV